MKITAIRIRKDRFFIEIDNNLYGISIEPEIPTNFHDYTLFLIDSYTGTKWKTTDNLDGDYFASESSILDSTKCDCKHACDCKYYLVENDCDLLKFIGREVIDITIGKAITSMWLSFYLKKLTEKDGNRVLSIEAYSKGIKKDVRYNVYFNDDIHESGILPKKPI
jgi:hypothetical protein